MFEYGVCVLVLVCEGVDRLCRCLCSCLCRCLCLGVCVGFCFVVFCCMFVLVLL